MKIRPVHHAILCYMEWHCDRRLSFRTVRQMARDLARNSTEVERATRDLLVWGLISMRHDGENKFHIVRLGDGRETMPHTACVHFIRPAIPAIHRGPPQGVLVESRTSDTRIAA